MIYFIQAGGFVKIGSTSDLAERLRTLQCANPMDLKVLATIPGGRTEEAALHRRFATSIHRNEWFNLTSDLISFIGENATSDRTRVRAEAEEIRAAYEKVEW